MIADLLSQLVNKSLVIIEETQSGTRYRMLETIRQYSYEKLVESEGSGVLHDRHLEYFLIIDIRYYQSSQARFASR